jgi:hypothetical protein
LAQEEFDQAMKRDVEARVPEGVKAVLEEVLQEEMTEHLKAVRLGAATTKRAALVVVIATTVIPSRIHFYYGKLRKKCATWVMPSTSPPPNIHLTTCRVIGRYFRNGSCRINAPVLTPSRWREGNRLRNRLKRGGEGKVSRACWAAA